MSLRKSQIMNIPQGYKQTELGIIPEDWEVKKICEGLADVKSGKRLPSGYYVTNQHTKHPYIRVIDMYDGGVDTSNLMYVPDEAYKPIEKYRIFKDDIFISVAGTLGIVGKIPEWLDGANLTENANRLTNITCYRDYLLYYLRSPYIQDVISSEQTIGAQPKLALMRIRNFDIALPKDVAEQRAIAEALSDVDGLIAALDKKIAKKRLLKQGAMQQLLTGKKRLPGFTDEWVEKKVKDVFRVTRGYVLATNKVVERPDGYYKYPVFSSQTQNNGVMGYYSDYLFEDAITWTTDGANAGEVNYRQGKFYCTNVCGVLISEEGYANECVASIINMVAKSHVSYIGNPKLMNNVMADIEICIPPSIKEQQAIATILSDMDKEIADLEAQRDKYRLLKSGMMQKLLTGQIRLK